MGSINETAPKSFEDLMEDNVTEEVNQAEAAIEAGEGLTEDDLEEGEDDDLTEDQMSEDEE